MEQSKNWWQSKTIWYTVLGVLFNGYNVAAQSSGGQLPVLPDWAVLALNAILGGGAINGRITATEKIGGSNGS